MQINQEAKALFAAHSAYEDELTRRRTKPSVSVSRAVSFVAYTFERIRNSIDYRDDHFLRRSSIARSLTRKFTIQTSSTSQAEKLLQELVLARYFPSDFIPHELTEEIARVLEKYKKVVSRANPEIRDWLVKIAAVEIDRILVPPYREDGLTNLLFSGLEGSIEMPQEEDPRTKNRLIYVTAARAAVGADASLISFLLLNSYYPKWLKNEQETIEEVKNNLTSVYQKIQADISHPSKEPLLRFFQRRKAPFLLLSDVASRLPVPEAEEMSPEELEKQLSGAYRERLAHSRTRFNRAATRAIISIFLTKMLVLLLLELPFEKLVLGEVNLVTLGMNLLFPPAVLFLIVNAINLPGERNEKRVVEHAKEILASGKMDTEIFIYNPRPRPKILSAFHYIYAASLLAIVAGTFTLFLKLGFSVPSTIIMLIFLSLVVFFGFLIRQQARELVLEEREGLFTPIINFFSLPFIRVGRYLSRQLVRFNFLIFLLDVFLEAPFKAFFRVAQQAVRFVKEKHEEAITQVP